MLDKQKQRPHRSYKNRTTDVILLLDASGSMQPRCEETIREVNRYLDQLRNDGLKYRVTVKTFNTEVQTLVRDKDIRDVGDLERSEYRPDGWTALLDAVGETLSNGLYPLRDYYGQHVNGDRVFFVVITDGEENRSKRYGLGEVRRMIDDRRSEDFQFVFLGNGPSSWRVGANLGFNISVQTDWNDPRNSENIYKSLYAASNTMSSGGRLTANMFNTGSTSGTMTTPQVKK